MPDQVEFSIVFKNLQSILKLYAGKLTIKADAAESYSLNGTYSKKWEKELSQLTKQGFERFMKEEYS